MRYEKLHYANIGTASSPQWVLINEGITDFTNSLNPETDTRQYIADKTAREKTKSYQPSYAYSGLLNDDDPFSKWLYGLSADQKLNIKVPIVSVDTWDETTSGSGLFTARMATYNVIPDNDGSGAGGDDLNLSGTISQDGDLVKGTWDMEDQEFTPAA
jgi:hypothetical protein